MVARVNGKARASAAKKPRRVRVGQGPYAVVAQDELSVVYWGTVVLYHFRADDHLGRHAAAVDLVRLHKQRPIDVSRALEIPRRTLYRLLARFDEGGIDALAGRKGGKRPTKIRDTVARRLLAMKRRGIGHGTAARRLGVSKSGVANALKRLKWKRTRSAEKQPVPAGVNAQAMPVPLPAVEGVVSPTEAMPASLPAVEGVASATDGEKADEIAKSAEQAPSGPAATVDVSGDVESGPSFVEAEGGCLPSFGVNPLDRSLDRTMARLGLLRDAAPQFASGERIPRAGAFLAVPLLVDSGIFDLTRKLYGDPKPAFYGIRTCVLMFTLMALLRVKRVEDLKEVSPWDLGRIIGLDRAPEVKTLRRKLNEMAELRKGLELMRELGQRRAKQSAETFAFLYVDGHVRVYNGQRELPKTYVMQRRLALPATTDYWVNDVEGNPVLVVTAEANEGMTTMLPVVLSEVRRVIGDRRATIVFDRGGWSPKLFAALIDDNWDIMTYRKGKSRRVPLKLFHKQTAKIEEREVSYELAETRIRLRGCRTLLRQITMLGDDGYQTQIVTSTKGIEAIEVAYRMFARWRQENFFKYMLAEYALDALVDYGTEPADPTRTVLNPKRKKLAKRIKATRAKLATLQQQYGVAAVENSEAARPTMRGFKIANATVLGKPLQKVAATLRRLEAQRSKLPVRVPVSQTLKDNEPIRLRTETKRISQ